MMKCKISLHLALVFIIGILFFPQTSMAEQPLDDSKIVASSKSTNTLGKRTAGEITKENAKKNRIKKKRQNKADKKLKYIAENNRDFQRLSPVVKNLIKELPYEIRKKLKDIPRERRLDWIIGQIVERKAPMVAKRLCRNERFRQLYTNAKDDEKTKLLKLGLKRHVIGEMSKSGRRGKGAQRDRAKKDFRKRIKPEQKRKYAQATKKKKLDSMTDKVMREKIGEIRRQIENNPELKKKLLAMPEEKRTQYVRNQIREQVAQKMKQKGAPLRGKRPKDSIPFHKRPGDLREMSPEERRKFMKKISDYDSDFFYVEVIEQGDVDTFKMIMQDSELQKKLKNLPPEKRDEAFQRAMQRKLQKKIKKEIKGMKSKKGKKGMMGKKKRIGRKHGKKKKMKRMRKMRKMKKHRQKGMKKGRRRGMQRGQMRGQQRSMQKGRQRRVQRGHRNQQGMQRKGMRSQMNRPPMPPMPPPPDMRHEAPRGHEHEGWNPDRQRGDQRGDHEGPERRKMRDDDIVNIPPEVLHRFMEEPDLLREVIRRMPNEFKHLLRELLEDNFREMERDDRPMRERREKVRVRE